MIALFVLTTFGIKYRLLDKPEVRVDIAISMDEITHQVAQSYLELFKKKNTDCTFFDYKITVISNISLQKSFTILLQDNPKRALEILEGKNDSPEMNLN